MKMIITESQYKKLINESFPENIELPIGEKINKFIVKVFQWCHKNAQIKSRFKKNDSITSYTHPILQLKKDISKIFALDEASALIISWSFYLRYNPEGDYEQFLGEDLDFLGDFKVKSNVNVTSKQYANVDGDFYVLATDYWDVEHRLSRGDYYDHELDFDTLHQEHDGWGYDWEMDVDDGVEVDDYDDIEFIGI